MHNNSGQKTPSRFQTSQPAISSTTSFPGKHKPIDVTDQLKLLQDALNLNHKESAMVVLLLHILNSKKINLKGAFRTLLCTRMDREYLFLFCVKASVFFGALTDTVKHTDCLTKMLDYKKEHIQDFITREDSELEYLAGLDAFPYISLMYHGMGLPKKEAVKEIPGWMIWRQQGVFNMELFRAFSFMNIGKGFPGKEVVEDIAGWEVWKRDGVFCPELLCTASFMNYNRGLLKKELVEKVLGWEVWKQDGVFCLKLFCDFAFTRLGQGLPEQEEDVLEKIEFLESLELT